MMTKLILWWGESDSRQRAIVGNYAGRKAPYKDSLVN